MYRHAYSESQRVASFKNICDDKDGDADSKLTRLGQLMNESHYSCRDDYECSSENLDELTDICRASGAIGSRLTGAGWGGFSISMLTPDTDAEAFCNTVYNKFHKSHCVKSMNECLLVAKPSTSACIIKM